MSNVVYLKHYIKKQQTESQRPVVLRSVSPKNVYIQRSPSPIREGGEQTHEFIRRLLPSLHDIDTRLEELDAKFNRLLHLLAKQQPQED